MFVNYNANPKKLKVGDCAIRAVSVATGLSWDDSYKLLANSGFKLKCAMNDVEAVDDTLRGLGFLVGKIRITKGDKRPKVKDFAQQHPDWYSILRVANHIVACGRGNYVDTWDSGDCSVYKYWYKPIN